MMHLQPYARKIRNIKICHEIKYITIDRLVQINENM